MRTLGLRIALALLIALAAGATPDSPRPGSAAVAPLMPVYHPGPHGAYRRNLEMITALPGKPIGLDVVRASTGSFALDVFSVDRRTFEDVWALARHDGFPGDGTEEDVLAARVLLPAQPTYHIAQTFSDERGVENVSIPPLATGLYVVRLCARHTSLTALNVTTIGVITARGPSDETQFAIDLRTFHKRNDVRFERDEGVARASVATNGDGVAVLPTTPWTFAIARGADGSVAFTSEDEWYVKQHPVPESDVVQTDRELYRAGDVVHYRVIERSGYADSLAVAKGRVNVGVLANQATDVQSRDAPLSPYGTASGTFAIPQAAPTGLYVLAVNRIDETDLPVANERSGEFYVAAYTTPRYTIAIVPSRPFALAGDIVRFSIVVRAADGTPVAGLRLHYRATLGSEAAGDLTTDADGSASVALKSEDREGGILTLEVRAVDGSSDPVITSASVPLFESSVRVEITRLHEYANIDQDFPLVVKATDHANAPVAHQTIQLHFKLDRGGSFLDVTLTTDDFGRATYIWHPVYSGLVNIEATATDARGSLASDLMTQTIVDAQHPFNDSLRLNLETSKTVYAANEPSRLFVTTDRGDVDALVCVSTGVHDRTFVVHLGTFDSSFVITPPAGVAAYGVTVWVPVEGGIAANSLLVHVAPSARRGLHLDVDQTLANPRRDRAQRIAVRVGDDRGDATDAEIGLSVARETALRPSSESADDPLETFDSGVFLRGGAASWRALTRTTALFDTPYPMGITHLEVPVTGGVDPGPEFPMLGRDVVQVSGLKHAIAATAFWAPALRTDAAGSAVASFRAPANGKVYALHALAVGRNGEFGEYSSALGEHGAAP